MENTVKVIHKVLQLNLKHDQVLIERGESGFCIRYVDPNTGRQEMDVVEDMYPLSLAELDDIDLNPLSYDDRAELTGKEVSMQYLLLWIKEYFDVRWQENKRVNLDVGFRRRRMGVVYKVKKSEISESDYRKYLDNPDFQVIHDADDIIIVSTEKSVHNGEVLENFNE